MQVLASSTVLQPQQERESHSRRERESAVSKPSDSLQIAVDLPLQNSSNAKVAKFDHTGLGQEDILWGNIQFNHTHISMYRPRG